MILRNLGVRHGRRALAAPASRTCLRSLSSSAPSMATPPTTFAEPPTPTATAPPIVSNVPVPAYLAAQIAARKVEVAKIAPNYLEYEHQRAHTRSVGSRVESRYHPDQYLDNPPHDASLEMLMAAQAHMGHNASQWNPANQRYIYGQRAGIHIISLETTAVHLRRAARVVEDVAYYGGLILFAGTRPGQRPIVVRAAELAQGCHLYQKWTPGTITNRDVILASGRLKVVGAKDESLDGFQIHLRDRRPIVPDLVVCLNPVENHTLLHECAISNIPTIGIIDTDADPTWVTYQIPANDDSLRAVTLIAGVLARAGERGQRRRLEDAENGTVTWQTPDEVSVFIEREVSRHGSAVRAAVEQAKAEGILDDKPLRREDFMTDDEILRELSDLPLPLADEAE